MNAPNGAPSSGAVRVVHFLMDRYRWVLALAAVLAVISGHSTADCNSYRVSWYDRVHLVIRHKWLERGAFEVITTNKTATAA